MNATMEWYLQVIVNHRQHNWVNFLPLGKFAANNGYSESIKCSPFFAVEDLKPSMSFHGEPTNEQDQRCLNVHFVEKTMQQILLHLRVDIRWSQVLQKAEAN